MSVKKSMEQAVEELSEEAETLTDARLKIRDLRKKLTTSESGLQQVLQRLHESDGKLSLMLGLGNFQEPPKIKPRKIVKGKKYQATAVAIASDWHIEERVDPKTINFLNEYNPDIARASANNFFEGIRWAWKLLSDGPECYQIDTLLLWLGGDLITGYIHEELVESNFLSPTEAILLAQEFITDGICYLLQHTDMQIKLVCNYGNHGRCHDAATELLTRDGWKTYDQLQVGDLVATYRLSDGATEWQPLQDVYVAQYDGPMVAVQTRSADFMVTPRHRMVVRSHDKADEFVEMQKFLDKGTMGSYSWPKCALGSSAEYPHVSDDELRLLGWLITDGSYASQNGHRDIRIHQSKAVGLEQIESLLARLEISYTTHTRDREPPVICGTQVKNCLPETTINISRTHTSRLFDLLPDKRVVPDWMRSLSPRQFNIFLEGLLAGDGHVREEERVLYGRREVLDQIQELAVINGIPARVREDNRGSYVLSLPCSLRGYINDWDSSVSVVPYSGVIWCGTVANGTLITRRNGIPLVSGNTTPYRRISTGAANSFEWLLYHMLARSFAREDRVSFTIADGSISYAETMDHLIRFHHGDDVRYQGGVGGITIPLRKAVDSWNEERKADITVIGHYHQWIGDHHDMVVNGSLIGYNAYAQSIKARRQDPRQGLFIIDPERGKRFTIPLVVRDAYRPRPAVISTYRKAA